MRHFNTRFVVSAIAMSVSLIAIPSASADTVSGVAKNAVVAQSGITGSGSVKIDASTVGGSLTPSVSGTKNIGNASANSALSSAQSTYNDLSGRGSIDKSSEHFEGTYAPGTYSWSKTLTSDLNSVVTINGDSSSEFTFVVDGSAIFRDGLKMQFTGGASACNVTFILKSGVKIEGNTSLGGNFIAGAHQIEQSSTSNVIGRLISLQNSVNVGGSVDVSSCIPATPVPPVTPVTPAPSQGQGQQQGQQQGQGQDQHQSVVVNVTTPAPATVPSTPAAPAPVAVATPRKPITKKATPRKPVCVKVNSITTITGTSMKSAKLGKRTFKASKSGTSIRVSVNTGLFASKKQNLRLQVTFLDNSTKTLKVTATRCGVKVAKPHYTG